MITPLTKYSSILLCLSPHLPVQLQYYYTSNSTNCSKHAPRQLRLVLFLAPLLRSPQPQSFSASVWFALCSTIIALSPPSCSLIDLVASVPNNTPPASCKFSSITITPPPSTICNAFSSSTVRLNAPAGQPPVHHLLVNLAVVDYERPQVHQDEPRDRQRKDKGGGGMRETSG